MSRSALALSRRTASGSNSLGRVYIDLRAPRLPPGTAIGIGVSDQRARDCLTASPSITRISGCWATTTFEPLCWRGSVKSGASPLHGSIYRGQIVLVARQLGHRLPADVRNGLWQWTKRAAEARH